MTLQRMSILSFGLLAALGCGTSTPDGFNPLGAGTPPDDGSAPGAQSPGDDAAPGSDQSDSSTSAPTTDGGPNETRGDATSDTSTSPTPPQPEAGATPPRDAGTCPSLAGVDANTASALARTNETRLAMGSPCATMVASLNAASAKHCAYYAANAANASCTADPHTEVSSCTDYVAADFWTRDMIAGYPLSDASFEDMAFLDNGTGAAQTWIDSVWHRTPILDPWVGDLGYGAAAKCDTMDFGTGHTGASASLIVTYPYDGQTGVPTSFQGNYEGPTPPVPPGGWPSGYPVTVYVQDATMTVHEFSVDGGAQLAHQWITPQTSQDLTDGVVLYGNSPLTSATRYRVHVSGTRNKGGAAVDVSFTFTTK